MVNLDPHQEGSGPLPAEPSDDDLVRRAQKDPKAFAPIYQRYAKKVYRYAFGRVATVADAEEITSQAFFDALASLPRYQHRGRFAAWLFAIVRRRCADYFRRHSPIDRIEDPPPFADVDDPDADDSKRLAEILSRLRPPERELLSLRYGGELSYREIGHLLGKTEPAIKMAMTRLVRKMKILWESRDV